MDNNSFYTQEANQRTVINYNKGQLDQEKKNNSKDPWTVQKIFLREVINSFILEIVKSKHLSRMVPNKFCFVQWCWLDDLLRVTFQLYFLRFLC